MKHRYSGFTLVEIALVMVIVSAVLAGGIVGFQSFRDSARYTETDNYLTNTRTALLGFALTNGYLPCPDTDGDGVQNVESHSANKTCTKDFGDIPWQDLGLQRTTVWNVPAFYAVIQNTDTDACDKTNLDKEVCYFENEEAPLFKLDTPPVAGTAGNGTLEIKNSAGIVVATDLLAVAGVYGQNALQTEADCAGQSSDEEENCDGDASFVVDLTRTNPDNFFDDQLIWIHANTVKGQMRDAGFF